MTESEAEGLQEEYYELKEQYKKLLNENKKLRKVLGLVRRNAPDYLPEYNSGESPSKVVEECSVEIAMGLIKINKALNDLGIDIDEASE